MRVALSTLVLSTFLSSGLAAQASSTTLKWGPAPPVFPKGAEMAVVSGDPGAAGMFTIQLSMPAGYQIPAHWHPTAEHVEVISGAFMFGMGDQLDMKAMKSMAPGDSGTIPAKMNHFAAAKTATVVAVTAMGPFAMTYVNPKDDPRTAKTPTP